MAWPKGRKAPAQAELMRRLWADPVWRARNVELMKGPRRKLGERACQLAARRRSKTLGRDGRRRMRAMLRERNRRNQKVLPKATLARMHANLTKGRPPPKPKTKDRAKLEAWLVAREKVCAAKRAAWWRKHGEEKTARTS